MNFRLAVIDHAPCRTMSTVRRRLRLPTSASMLASNGPCRTAAVDGRSQEESWTDRQHSTMRRLSPISNITTDYPHWCVEQTHKHTSACSACHKAALIHNVFHDNCLDWDVDAVSPDYVVLHHHCNESDHMEERGSSNVMDEPHLDVIKAIMSLD